MFLVEIGFKRGSVDKIMFIKREKKHILIAHVYVEDIVFGSIFEGLVEKFARCMSKEFEMTMMGKLSFFLGLRIK